MGSAAMVVLVRDGNENRVKGLMPGKVRSSLKKLALAYSARPMGSSAVIAGFDPLYRSLSMRAATGRGASELLARSIQAADTRTGVRISSRKAGSLAATSRTNVS